MNVTLDVYQRTISEGLHREYGHLKGGAFRFVASLIHVSPRTIANWFDESCSPRGTELIRLMQANDSIAQDIFNLVKQNDVQSDI